MGRRIRGIRARVSPRSSASRATSPATQERARPRRRPARRTRSRSIRVSIPPGHSRSRRARVRRTRRAKRRTWSGQRGPQEGVDIGPAAWGCALRRRQASLRAGRGPGPRVHPCAGRRCPSSPSLRREPAPCKCRQWFASVGRSAAPACFASPRRGHRMECRAPRRSRVERGRHRCPGCGRSEGPGDCGRRPGASVPRDRRIARGRPAGLSGARRDGAPDTRLGRSHWDRGAHSARPRGRCRPARGTSTRRRSHGPRGRRVAGREGHWILRTTDCRPRRPRARHRRAPPHHRRTLVRRSRPPALRRSPPMTQRPSREAPATSPRRAQEQARSTARTRVPRGRGSASSVRTPRAASIDRKRARSRPIAPPLWQSRVPLPRQHTSPSTTGAPRP